MYNNKTFNNLIIIEETSQTKTRHDLPPKLIS